MSVAPIALVIVLSVPLAGIIAGVFLAISLRRPRR
jgi:hypothetical protein